MTTPKLPPKSTKMKDSSTQDRTSLMQWLAVPFMVAFLVIRFTAIAGESSTGKTYFSLAVVKNFLDTNPDGYCLYFDTEASRQ